MSILINKSRILLSACMAAALLVSLPSHAVQFTLSDRTADTWTYTLTYDPLDNYAVLGAPETATIRLSGLAGVVSASGPTGTDYEDAWLDQVNRAWTPAVLNGGTEVVWTHVGAGTGNFSDAKHVYGFALTAPGIGAGTALVTTAGFTTDVSFDYLPRDIVTSVAAPVPEPETWALALAGVAVLARTLRRRQHNNKPSVS